MRFNKSTSTLGSIVPATKASGHKRKDFLSLPPELRNMIYDLVAAEEPGLIHSFECGEAQRSIPSMLLTCHQVAREYKPILLATAPLKVDLGPSDFSRLALFMNRMPEWEYNALEANPHGVTINLSLDIVHPSKSLPAVLTWIGARPPDDRIESITWDYSIQHSPPPPTCLRGTCEIHHWFAEQQQQTIEERRRLDNMMSESDDHSRLGEFMRLDTALCLADVEIFFECVKQTSAHHPTDWDTDEEELMAW